MNIIINEVNKTITINQNVNLKVLFNYLINNLKNNNWNQYDIIINNEKNINYDNQNKCQGGCDFVYFHKNSFTSEPAKQCMKCFKIF